MAQVIYPPLVEQNYAFMKSQGIDASKDEIYREMVRQNFIDSKGNPTQYAIDKGFVSEYTLEHETLSDFKKQFTVFKSYPKHEFCQVENVWYISNEIGNFILERLDKKQLTRNEMNQIELYYNTRNYENPRTVAEFKAVNYPLYEEFEDSCFYELNGLVYVGKEVVREMANKVMIGEIGGDIDKAYLMLQVLEDQ